MVVSAANSKCVNNCRSYRAAQENLKSLTSSIPFQCESHLLVYVNQSSQCANIHNYTFRVKFIFTVCRANRVTTGSDGDTSLFARLAPIEVRRDKLVCAECVYPIHRTYFQYTMLYNSPISKNLHSIITTTTKFNTHTLSIYIEMCTHHLYIEDNLVRYCRYNLIRVFHMDKRCAFCVFE